MPKRLVFTESSRHIMPIVFIKCTMLRW
jgi:hypothetical protein